MSDPKNSEGTQSGFVTLCHGEPWSGNVQYRYSNYSDKNHPEEEEERGPTEAVFGGNPADKLVFMLKQI